MQRNLFFFFLILFIALTFSGCSCIDPPVAKTPSPQSHDSVLAAWACGHLTQHSVLWGLPVYWWGRIGKILQVLGGVLAIAEVIGPERLRAFGYSIRQEKIFDKVRLQFSKAFWGLIFLLSLFLVNGFLWTKKLKEKYKPIEDKVNLRAGDTPLAAAGISGILTTIFFISLFRSGVFVFPTSHNIIDWVMLFGGVYLIYFPSIAVMTAVIFVIMIFPYLVAALLRTVINGFLINPLAWFVSHPKNSNLIKLLSVALVTIGFIF